MKYKTTISFNKIKMIIIIFTLTFKNMKIGVSLMMTEWVIFIMMNKFLSVVIQVRWQITLVLVTFPNVIKNLNNNYK
jgi:hypothetical protein